MPRRECPSCNRRLPYAGKRCLHCGWNTRVGGAATESGRAIAGRARFWTLVLLGLVVLGTGVAFRNAEAVSYWYASFAARYLPASLSSLAPTDTDAGAFFYCARQVSKRMDGEFSVETFPTLAESQSQPLDGGRYRIQSFVDEAREDGGRVRHLFVCTVRHERGRWVLEDLKMERSLAAEGTLPALGLQSD